MVKGKTTQVGLKKCKLCGKLFKFDKQIKQHIRTDHNDSIGNYL